MWKFDFTDEDGGFDGLDDVGEPLHGRVVAGELGFVASDAALGSVLHQQTLSTTKPKPNIIDLGPSPMTNSKTNDRK